MGKLDGRVAIVTGSSKGIGKAIALALAEEGCNVVVNYNSDQAGAEAVANEIRENGTGAKALVVQANIADIQAATRLVEAAIQNFGQVDILVNNAGITKDKSFKNMTPEMWHAVMDTNLHGMFYVTKQALPSMLARKWGRIINISSIIGQAGAFGQSNYAATKGGMISFTKSLALETAKQGITVNAVCPGYIETEMVTAGIPQERLDAIRAKVPMGRLGTAEEVARVVAFLCTDADYITGAELNINGGAYM